MSDFPFVARKKTGEDKGKIVEGMAFDDYFGRHRYGYRINGAKSTLSQKTFDHRYETLSEEEVTAVKSTNIYIESGAGATLLPQAETLEQLRERVFIVTDACMWEANRKNGTFHPHAIEVVDTETGQTRYIESGARISFVEGKISDGRTQESYNEYHNK